VIAHFSVIRKKIQKKMLLASAVRNPRFEKTKLVELSTALPKSSHLRCRSDPQLDAIFSRNLNMLASAVRNPRLTKKTHHVFETTYWG
jgi:hypothetical protein